MVNMRKDDPQRRIADALRKASRMGGVLGAVAVVQARERFEKEASDFLERPKKGGLKRPRKRKRKVPRRIPASQSAKWVVRLLDRVEPGRVATLPELFRLLKVRHARRFYFFSELLSLERAGLIGRQSAPQQNRWSQHAFWLTEEGARWREVVRAEKLCLCFGPGWSARAISVAVGTKTPAEYSSARSELVERWHGFHRMGGDLSGKHSGRTGSPERPRSYRGSRKKQRDDTGEKAGE